jgi:A/G-specific adenine glycosylase
MERQLPANDDDARLFNAAAMELGAIVCTARAPRCDDCPIASQCAWRAAGYPSYVGAKRATQKKYEGSDRQVRGLILAELRASDIPVTNREIESVWADVVQRDRALASLLADGLVIGDPALGYQLPTGEGPTRL